LRKKVHLFTLEEVTEATKKTGPLMGWDKHGSRKYYTRTHRRNGKFVREHVGTGAFAEVIALGDALRRAKRKAIAAQQRQEQARWTAADEILRRFERLLDLITRAALSSAGYHQHARGQWRKKRWLNPLT
jgi:hypothetical protein